MNRPSLREVILRKVTEGSPVDEGPPKVFIAYGGMRRATLWRCGFSAQVQYEWFYLDQPAAGALTP